MTTKSDELKKLKRQNTALKNSNTALSSRNRELEAELRAEADAQAIEKATEPIPEKIDSTSNNKPADGTSAVPVTEPKVEVHSQGPGPPGHGLAERAAVSPPQAVVQEEAPPPPPVVEQTDKPRARPHRRPLSRRDVLSFPRRPGYYRRVVNDTGGGRRIQAFKDAGYEEVRDGSLTGADGEAGRPSQIGKNVTRVVGTDQQGAIRGVLMEIPLEFYNEDQAAKQRRIQEMEDTINRTQKQKVEGVYGDGIQIKH